MTESFNIPKEPTNAYGKLGPAGEIDLSSYEGKAINIAFKYSGALDTKTTTIQLDNIHIAREVSVTSTVVKEARAVVDNDKSTWIVTLPSDIPDILVNEDFEKGKDYDNVALDGWCNSKMKGEKSWEYRSYQNNRYASITAFNNGELEAWLITPALILQKEMVLNFDFEYRYLAGDVFTLMISTDFNGDPSNISSATWVDITPDNLDKTNDKAFTSYSVDLASYIGQTIYVGFRYIGNNATGLTTTCQIDNVYVGIPK
ncbi:choice-of-anchor J domain-containing protein [Bacteroides nordii]|uniref:choice-of-anchor J domain-containing protein n=1 Tax=Bacteroides nordii TaxID=291645 RepID=UPI003999B5D4